MNSFENNTPLPTQLHPGADRAMDGLLQELANNNIADDEAFLSGLESALDQAREATSAQPIAVRSTGQRWWKWGLLGSAAACAVGMLAWRDSQLKQLTKNKSDQPHEANPSVEPIQNEPLFEVIQNRFATLDEVVASYERISGIQLLRSINLTGNIWMPRAKTASAQLKKEDAVAYYNGAILANGFSLHENSQKLSTLTYDRSVFSSADCSPANVQAAYDARQNSLAMAEAAPSIAEKIVRTGRIEPIQKLETEADQLMAEGNYEAAIDKFQTALSGLPEAPMTAKLRAVLIAKFSNACIRQADKLGKMARLDDARAVLNRVLVSEIDPENQSAKILMKRLDEPNYFNPFASESGYKNVNGVAANDPARVRTLHKVDELLDPATPSTASGSKSGTGALDQPREESPLVEPKGNVVALQSPGVALDFTELDALTLFNTNSDSNSFLPLKRRSGLGSESSSFGRDTMNFAPFWGEIEPNYQIGAGAGSSRRLPSAADGFFGTFDQYQLGISPPWLKPRTYEVTSGFRQRFTPAASDGFAEGIQLAAAYFAPLKLDYGFPIDAAPTPGIQSTLAFEEGIRGTANGNLGSDFGNGVISRTRGGAFAPLGSTQGGLERNEAANATPLFAARVGGVQGTGGRGAVSGSVRRRMVVPENGLGYVGNNGTTGDYREENPNDPISSGEKYSSVMENPFLSPLKAPLSTFSVDVDTASYANLRRMIQSGQNVPPAAVRIEEMVNYFSYSYPQPEGPHPFSVQVESAACPWNEAHRLVKIGLKAKEIAREKRPSANLVFLCDVSGSMNSADKLPLLVQNLTVLTNELNADDSVGIVVYAGSEGVALPPTSGGDKQTILRALTLLSAGGSTNGGAGINRAYQMAQERFIKGGINRVVLCTDGDFNVGTTSRDALVNLVEEKAKGGVFLTVCGYGQGNLNDSMMEAITNKGNGVYHYVDSEKEGKKIFKDELFGTLMTVAKDVKLQVEFNPAKVGQYRLVGYDNRMLKKEDFANDKVDAGDIGAGHTVTALYEVIPPGTPAADKPVENLKYQQSQPVVNETPPAVVTNNLPEMLTVKLRYKEPEGTESKLLEVPHTDAGQPLAAASSDFKFASAVAEFGEWIRGKRVAGRSPLQMAEQAESARGNDPHGLRGEFIELVKKAGSQRQ